MDPLLANNSFALLRTIQSSKKRVVSPVVNNSDTVGECIEPVMQPSSQERGTKSGKKMRLEEGPSR